MHNNEKSMEKLVALCKGRGFVFPGSELYGGLANTWDYGPLGAELKRNVKAAWWLRFVQQNEHNVGLDSAILMNPRVWEASGHVGGFCDPLMDCGAKDFTDGRQFNLLFETHQGVTQEGKTTIYLRPETAQGIFVNFKNVQRTTRKKIPFGVGQIGKSFRNEITPGNFTFRTREFEQMELEFFCKPGTDLEWFAHWKAACRQFLADIGLREESLRTRDHESKELAHYAAATSDIEFLFPFGWGELWGIADRTDFDLVQHETHSGESLEYFDQEANEKYRPYVIEPSVGVDRLALALLADAYDEEVVDAEKNDVRTVLRLHPAIAPVKAAVLPLSKKLAEPAKALHTELSALCNVEYDETGSIGKRYRRQDEIGTPICITVDFETEVDGCVTLRARDSMEQSRVPLADVARAVLAQLKF